MKDVLSRTPGKAFMLCNEAIARGAIEADVKVVAFYPGAPTSEILDTFSEAMGTGSFDYQMQIATNEKVALEICAGASFAGFRSLTAMKSVGMNVASDTLFVLGYTGVRGGMVVVVADDPHAHSSQSEQDGRFFAPNAYIPMLEPSTAQEAKDMVAEAFEISERHRVPVIIRTVTRVNHQSGIVELKEIRRGEFRRARWRELNEEYRTLGEVARQKKLKMLERRGRLEEEFAASRFNFVIEGDKGAKAGIVTGSVSYLYVLEAMRMLGVRLPVLKIGTTYPMPKKVLEGFLKGLDAAIVVEELSPFLENEVILAAKDANPAMKVFGKRTGNFSEAWELSPDLVARGIASALGIGYADRSGLLEEARRLKEGLPERYPTFCPGCPHRGTFAALIRALRGLAASGRGYYFANDIGCYSMWVFPPFSKADSTLCMGASVGIANGLSNVIEERVVAIVGDSTFYHAAIPAILNAVHNRNKFTLFILDNSVTAMTGQQPNLSTEYTAGWREEGKRVPIEEICRAAGVEFVEVVDSYNVKENAQVFKRALEYDGLAVVVSRRECALYGDRRKRKRGERIVPYKVEKPICRRAYACIRDVHCPAHELDGDRQPRISPELCDGCSVCSRMCAFFAIKPGEGGA